MRNKVIVLLLLYPLWSVAQYPQDYFRSPLDTVLLLSAPFGQLRDNHFHSGVDIRTFEKEGLPVYAAADGFVSRIKVSPWGYGKALYIDHPNGYTTVYAHLQRFNDSLLAFTKSHQYQRQSFEVEIYPKPQQIKVKKGDLIAYSGNSGGSTGPHLHYEIRNTKTEFPINPLLFNMPVNDTVAPFFRSFSVYNVMCNRPRAVLHQKLAAAKFKKEGNVISYADTMTIPQGWIGLGAELYDYITDSEREQNVLSLQVFIDTSFCFLMNLQSFSFDDSRFINCHLDYEKYLKEKVRVQKCFIDDGNGITIYKSNAQRGKYYLADNRSHLCRIIARDASGHESELRFYIKGHDTEKLSAWYLPECSYDKFVPGRFNRFQLNGIRVDIPKDALYDTLDFCYESLPANKKTASRIFRIGDKNTPLNHSITVSIQPDTKDTSLTSKMLLARMSDKGWMGGQGGEYQKGWVSATVRSFGDYTIGIDTVPPKARFLNVKDSVCTDTTGLKMEIIDSFSGIDSYRFSINGQWTLTDYDAKNNLLIYEFDAKTIRRKKLNIELLVIDKKKNKTQLQKFIYFP